MTENDRPESLAAALAELQQHLPRIGKDAQAQYGKYADLADVSRALLPVLAERGFSWICCPIVIGERFELRYWLRWDGDDEIIEGYYPLPKSGTPQQIGSAITYARRYCLLAVTGAAPDEDDDDAQAAEQAARAQRNHDQPRVADMEDWPPENQPGPSSKEQRQSIYIALGRRGIKDHKGAIERLIRRDIGDPRDMSHNEATSVLARVRSWDGRTEELLSSLVENPVERSQADV